MIVAIVPHCDWPTLVAWRGTSRSLFAVVTAYLRVRYLGYISPFVDDVALFNWLLRSHSAIIAGPTALDFFVPDPAGPPTSLDVYLPTHTYAHFLKMATSTFRWSPFPRSALRSSPSSEKIVDTIVDPLQRDFGHTFAPRDWLVQSCVADNGLTMNRAMTCSSFVVVGEGVHRVPDTVTRHRVDSKRAGLWSDGEGSDVLFDPAAWLRGFKNARTFTTATGLLVNVICSYSSSPVTPLRFVWSSLLMNFLTPDGCVCGFPNATLRGRAGLLVSDAIVDESETARQYAARGFLLQSRDEHGMNDVWDRVSFGERHLLALDYRETFDSPSSPLPIRPGARGWVVDTAWRSWLSCEFRLRFSRV